MKIVIVNGSCRRGNTLSAIEAFKSGLNKEYEVEIIPPETLNIGFVHADMIVFATPVYWWGMSAQLKMIIDKCYSKGLQLKNKKVGLIVIGGSPVDSIQYELICKQFDCMANYLSWDLAFKKCYYATQREDLKKDKLALKELEECGKEV